MKKSTVTRQSWHKRKLEEARAAGYDAGFRDGKMRAEEGLEARKSAVALQQKAFNVLDRVCSLADANAHLTKELCFILRAAAGRY